MKEYLDCLKYVMDNGIDSDDRTGVGTRSVFGYQMRFDLSKGFPAVTTKKLAWKPVVAELLWFLEGSTDERRLAEIQYEKSREEIADKNTIWTANADFQGKNLGYTNNELVKQLGPVYGAQWRNFAGNEVGRGTDQISWLINEIKSNPNSRRLVVSAWSANQIHEMALMPCHYTFQFNVINNRLSCMFNMRSNDVFLGLPFNIASYALLTHMIAQVCDLEVGDLVYSGGNVHIYTNHFDAVNEQLSREPLPLPNLWLNPEIKNIDEFTMDNIKLIDYQSHPPIKAPMAV